MNGDKPNEVRKDEICMLSINGKIEQFTKIEAMRIISILSAQLLANEY